MPAINFEVGMGEQEEMVTPIVLSRVCAWVKGGRNTRSAGARVRERWHTWISADAAAVVPPGAEDEEAGAPIAALALPPTKAASAGTGSGVLNSRIVAMTVVWPTVTWNLERERTGPRKKRTLWTVAASSTVGERNPGVQMRPRSSCAASSCVTRMPTRSPR